MQMEDHVTGNGVIMMSLPKTMKNADVRETRHYISFERS